jgi:hypothetical protein
MPQNPAPSAPAGINIKSLAHLVALPRDLKDDYVVLDFDGRAAESLVFPRTRLLASTEEILTDNGVRAAGSADMLKVWQAKAP